MLKIISNGGQNFGDLSINIHEEHNRILLMFESINENVSGGAVGTMYKVEFSHRDSNLWVPLETSVGSNVQIEGILALPNENKKGVIQIGHSSSGQSPLVGGMKYRVILLNDNISGTTTLNVWLKSTRDNITSSSTSTGEVSQSGKVTLTTAFNVNNENSNQVQYTFSGYPDYASMGLTLENLMISDPEYPSAGASSVILAITNGISSNGANVANVLSQSVIATLDANGTDLASPYFANVIGRAGVQQDDLDQNTFYIKLNNGQFLHGLNTIEEAGSNAYGQITVIGYVG